MKSYTKEENEDLFWKVYRNIYLNDLIYSNIYKSQIYIDALNMKYVPEIPKLNNLKFISSSGYCNWLIKNLMFNDNSGDESNFKIKNIINKNGLNKFSLLSKFRIDSMTIDSKMELVTVSKLCDDGKTEYQIEQWEPVQFLKEIEFSSLNNLEISNNELPHTTTSLNILELEQLLKIESGSLPNLKKLKIRDIKELELNNQFLSQLNLKSIHLGEYYDKEIVMESIPSSVTHLNLGWRFNQKIIQIPLNIKSLVLGEVFNHEFKKDTFSNCLIERLEIGANFDKYESLINIPQSVHTLVFGNHFFRELNDSFKIPQTVKTLIFSKQFNSIIPNGILNNEGGLETLIFGDSFTQPLTIENVPSSVKSLIISNKAQQNISLEIFNRYFSLEAALKKGDGHFEIGDGFKKYYFDKGNNKLTIPKSINSLTLHNDTFLKYHNIPKTIKYLKFASDFINTDHPELNDINHTLTNFEKRYFIKARDIPKSTTHLSIQSPFVVLDFLPSHITHFHTPNNYTQQINILKNNNNLKCLNIKLININYINHDELKPLKQN